MEHKKRHETLDLDGNPTVEAYLNIREIDFVPLSFEWNGATGKAWDHGTHF